jgi:hypothetical protein
MFTIKGILASSSCAACSKAGGEVYVVEGQGLTRNICPACLRRLVKVFAPTPSPGTGAGEPGRTPTGSDSGVPKS